jgi:hypothetical protein
MIAAVLIRRLIAAPYSAIAQEQPLLIRQVERLCADRAKNADLVAVSSTASLDLWSIFANPVYFYCKAHQLFPISFVITAVETEPKNNAEESDMTGCRLNAVGVILYLFVGCMSKFQLADKKNAIEGVWEVEWVCRDGKLDPKQVGAHLIFANGVVLFQPKVREFVDGTG